MSVWGQPPHYAGSAGDILVIKHTWPQESAHIIRHDPQDVIADCKAKLALIDEFTVRDCDTGLMLGPSTPRQHEWGGLRLAVRLLASGYRHREGYAEHWPSSAPAPLAAS